jgi:hypothetical protein
MSRAPRAANNAPADLRRGALPSAAVLIPQARIEPKLPFVSSVAFPLLSIAAAFRCFSLFFNEIISDQLRLDRGNPRVPGPSCPKKQRRRPLNFAVPRYFCA